MQHGLGFLGKSDDMRKIGMGMVGDGISSV